ncbi:MAG: aspartate carbamoyltransferase catalytic subunit [Wenzhouxiangellaceae bacterium]|nr:aspartate carbamoyltransferase catalytic subunit [Wenzhouxiangellaceae bacterium]
MNRHLLDIESLSDDDIGRLLARTAELRSGEAPSPRRGAAGLLFAEPSTRTRVSFELAARRLGLDPVRIDEAGSSAVKGESLVDTARTLAAMGLRALVVRHRDEDAPRMLARALDAEFGADGPGVVNAGDGTRSHPSQALLDAAVLQAEGLDWASARIVIVGDIRHSRVARSDATLFHRLGAREIRLAGPAGWMPDDAELAFAERCDTLDAALDGADVVVCLRVQRERHDGSSVADDDIAAWRLDADRAAGLATHACILHPGPVNRGVEISSAVADEPRSRILEQVRTGVALRTAVFEWLIPGDETPC